MKNVKVDWFTLIVLIAIFIIILLSYSRIPEMIPRGWNLAGEVIRMGHKSEILIMLSGITCLFVLLSLFPSWDKSGILNSDIYIFFVYVRTCIFVLLLFPLYDIINAFGFMLLPMNRLVGLAIGAMFISIGHYLPQLRQNSFIGIRTPWTLKDNDTWKATHKQGRYATIISGIIMMTSALILEVKHIIPVCLFVVIIWAFFTIGYSYYYFNNKSKNPNA